MELTESSWQVLPDPKVNWNFEPQAIAMGAVEDIGAGAAADGLDQWVERMYAAYFDPAHEVLLLNMLEGHAKVQAGRTEEAAVIFQKVHATGGASWFKEHYRPYLDFVKN